jgi:hypothetical protein
MARMRGGPRDGERLPIYRNLTYLMGGIAIPSKEALATRTPANTFPPFPPGGFYQLSDASNALHWVADG